MSRGGELMSGIESVGRAKKEREEEKNVGKARKEEKEGEEE